MALEIEGSENMNNFKSWKRSRPMKPRRRVKAFEPSFPGLFTRSSAMQRSDPSFWEESREDEAEAAAKAATGEESSR